MAKMKAAIFVEPQRGRAGRKAGHRYRSAGRPDPGAASTICGTDVHILKGVYPVRRGLTVGHEPVGAKDRTSQTRWEQRRRETMARLTRIVSIS